MPPLRSERHLHINDARDSASILLAERIQCVPYDPIEINSKNFLLCNRRNGCGGIIGGIGRRSFFLVLFLAISKKRTYRVKRSIEKNFYFNLYRVSPTQRLDSLYFKLGMSVSRRFFR